MNVWTDAANALAEQPTSPTQRRDLTMRPTSILDPRFRYVPSNCTDVTATWRRFGFNPQRNAERRGELVGTATLIRSSGLQFLVRRLRPPSAASPPHPIHESGCFLEPQHVCQNSVAKHKISQARHTDPRLPRMCLLPFS